jgi:DNA-binding SARP family transcriptional activator
MSKGDVVASGVCFYRLLGSPSVERDGREVELGPPQAKTVLTALLMAANRLVSSDKLAEELWGESPPASARVQVQGLISRLRRALRSPDGEQPIQTKGTGYVLRVEPGQVDVDLFGEGIADGRALLTEGRYDEGVSRIRDTLTLWRGQASAMAADVLGQWEELRLAVLEDCVEAELLLGRHDRLVPELRELVAAYPFRERSCGQLMTALARAGRIAEASEAYRKWHRRLADELGVEPSPAIRALHSDILRAEPGLSSPGYTVYRKPVAPCQLPPGLPDFVGREAQVQELLAELNPDESRDTPPVLVLTGVGGIGKTSMAVRLARQIRDAYPDGQLFSALRGTTAEPRTPEAVLAGFLRSFGVPSDMIPPDLDECASLFRSVLHGRRVLLVLDDAASETQLRPLVPAEPGCAVIITSRFSLAGLELGRSVPLDVLSTGDAAALLARLVGSLDLDEEAESAGQVLEYCGGLPLALRIVGSRLADRSLWKLGDVATALSVERQRLDWLQTGDLAVRSSFSLSYRQLDPDRQKLFRRLALLPSADFPEWVAAAAMGVDSVERPLEDLHRRNMVQLVERGGGRPRYRMHDLLRSFALEAVAEESAAERAAATGRALGGWLWLAERAAARLPGSVLRPAPGEATRRPMDPAAADALVHDPLVWFQAEHLGLEAAISRAADAGLGEMAWELAVVGADYFDHRGQYAEWSRCHKRALGAAISSGCVRGEAALLRGLGQLHLYRDEFPQATKLLNRSLKLSEAIGDRRGMASALTGLGVVSRATGRPDEARERGQRALVMFTEAGHGLGVAHMHTSLAVAYLEMGRLGEAEAELDRAMAVCAELGDDHRTALVLRRFGQLHLARDDPRRAMTCLRRALGLLESLRDEQCAAQVRLDIGRTHTILGERQAAARVLTGASSQFVGVGNHSSAAACERLLGSLVT